MRSRKRSYKKSSVNVSRLAHDVAKMKRHFDGEIKQASLAITATPGWNGVATTINAIPQGSNEGERDGDHFKCLSLQFACSVSNTRIANARIIVIHDYQNNTQLGDISSGLGTADAPIAPKQWDTRKNFKVLYDRRIALHPSKQNVMLEKYIPLNVKTQMEFAGTPGVNILRGAIKVFMIGDFSANFTSFRWVHRFTYVDN